MSQRFTAKDVRAAFATFCDVAAKAGFDTATWTLREGNQSSGRDWRHYALGESGGMNGTPFRESLGWTAKEAYETLSTRIDTLIAVSIRDAERANT